MRLWAAVAEADRHGTAIVKAEEARTTNLIALAALDDASEARTVVYLARAVAFALIVAAIVDKNRPARDRSD